MPPETQRLTLFVYCPIRLQQHSGKWIHAFLFRVIMQVRVALLATGVTIPGVVCGLGI